MVVVVVVVVVIAAFVVVVVRMPKPKLPTMAAQCHSLKDIGDNWVWCC